MSSQDPVAPEPRRSTRSSANEKPSTSTVLPSAQPKPRPKRSTPKTLPPTQSKTAPAGKQKRSRGRKVIKSAETVDSTEDDESRVVESEDEHVSSSPLPAVTPSPQKQFEALTDNAIPVASPIPAPPRSAPTPPAIAVLNTAETAGDADPHSTPLQQKASRRNSPIPTTVANVPAPGQQISDHIDKDVPSSGSPMHGVDGVPLSTPEHQKPARRTHTPSTRPADPHHDIDDDMHSPHSPVHVPSLPTSRARTKSASNVRGSSPYHPWTARRSRSPVSPLRLPGARRSPQENEDPIGSSKPYSMANAPSPQTIDVDDLFTTPPSIRFKRAPLDAGGSPLSVMTAAFAQTQVPVDITANAKVVAEGDAMAAAEGDRTEVVEGSGTDTAEGNETHVVDGSWTAEDRQTSEPNAVMPIITRVEHHPRRRWQTPPRKLIVPGNCFHDQDAAHSPRSLHYADMFDEHGNPISPLIPWPKGGFDISLGPREPGEFTLFKAPRYGKDDITLDQYLSIRDLEGQAQWDALTALPAPSPTPPRDKLNTWWSRPVSPASADGPDGEGVDYEDYHAGGAQGEEIFLDNAPPLDGQDDAGDPGDPGDQYIPSPPGGKSHSGGEEDEDANVIDTEEEDAHSSDAEDRVAIVGTAKKAGKGKGTVVIDLEERSADGKSGRPSVAANQRLEALGKSIRGQINDVAAELGMNYATAVRKIGFGQQEVRSGHLANVHRMVTKHRLLAKSERELGSSAASNRANPLTTGPWSAQKYNNAYKEWKENEGDDPDAVQALLAEHAAILASQIKPVKAADLQKRASSIATQMGSLVSPSPISLELRSQFTGQ